MAKKAIKVTSNNVDVLNKRFFREDSGVPAAIGYFLLANFGEDGDYDMVSAANFNEQFHEGQKLRNGFFEAVPKSLVS